MTNEIITVVPGDVGEARFSYRKDAVGRWLLGYEYIFSTGGAIRLAAGDSEPSATEVLVYNSDLARAYLAAMEWIDKASSWNAKRFDIAASVPVWSRNDLKDAVRRIVAWAAKPNRAGEALERLGRRVDLGPFSHHGVNTLGCVVVGGTTLRLGFAPTHFGDAEGVLFKAYPERPYSGVWEAWRLPAYDSQEAKHLLADTVGKLPVDEWNDSMSMVFPIDCDPRIVKAFSSREKERAPSPLPEGWA